MDVKQSSKSRMALDLLDTFFLVSQALVRHMSSVRRVVVVLMYYKYCPKKHFIG